MFDISFWEILIIGAIALVVVGPERLPKLLRTIGLWVGRARASFQSIRDEVEREVNAEGLRETRRAIESDTRDAMKTVEKSVSEAKADGDLSESDKPKGDSQS